MSRARAFLGAAVGFSLLAAALMALRIMLEGEPWHERTIWIVAIASFGGLVAAPLTLVVVGFLSESRLGRLAFFDGRMGQVARAGLAGLGFGFTWLAASAALFVFHNRVLAGQYEIHEERPILGFLFSSLQTLGLYAFSIPRYALPWVLPMLMLMAALGIPRLLAMHGRQSGNG